MTAALAYRAAAPRVEDVEPLHRGPRDACPACGAKNHWQCGACKVTGPVPADAPPLGYHDCGVDHLSDRKQTLVARITGPVYCAPGRRVRVGPWWWPVRCTDGDHIGSSAHLHQRCLVCGAQWICALSVPNGTRPLVIT